MSAPLPSRPDPSIPENGVRKIAAWLPMSSTALDDIMRTPDLMSEAIDRRLNPWRYPDPQWPRFVLLPRVERARIGAQVVAGRLAAAWRVLAGRTPLSEQEDET